MSPRCYEPGATPSWWAIIRVVINYWAIMTTHIWTAAHNVHLWCGYNGRHLVPKTTPINTLKPGQNYQHFAHNIFKCVFWKLYLISLKFVCKGQLGNKSCDRCDMAFIEPIHRNKLNITYLLGNKSSFVQVMAWHRTGAKPLPEPMVTWSTDTYESSLIRLEWVKGCTWGHV